MFTFSRFEGKVLTGGDGDPNTDTSQTLPTWYEPERGRFDNLWKLSDYQ